MSIFTARRKRQSQPQYSVRISQDGVGKGVRLLFNPATGPVDLVTGRHWTATGNAKISEEQLGRVFEFDGSGDSFNDSGGYADLAGNGTFFCFLPVVGPPSAFGHIYLGSNSPSTMAFQVDGSGNVWMGSDSQATISAASWFNSTHRSLVCVSGPSAAQVKVFIDGQTAAATGVTAGASWSAGAKTIRLGGYPTGSNWDFSGQMLIAGWADRLWTLDDAGQFHDNPWSLFQAEPRRLYIVPASTGGSPQTLEPTAAEAIGEVGVPSLSAGSVSLSPSAAIAAAEAAVPTLTAGLASLVPAAASAVAEADVPSLTAGGANITPIAAIATAGVDNPDLTTEGSVLTPQVAIATAGVGNPILTAGAVTLAPSAASATAAVTDPSITNGSQLSPSAASASAAVSNPVLSAGAVSVDAEAAVAAANAEGSVFSAGGVQLAPPAASAVAVGSVPEITSGKVIDSVPAVAVAGVGSASFIAGQASIIPASAEGIAAGSTPAFALGQVALLPSAAFATAVVGDSFLIDGGMQWHSEMLYTIEAEDRSFTIPAENRAFSVPAV